jgi:hypothetical protein
MPSGAKPAKAKRYDGHVDAKHWLDEDDNIARTRASARSDRAKDALAEPETMQDLNDADG